MKPIAFVLASLFLAIVNPAHSQTKVSITARVEDASSRPIPAGDAFILSSIDSSLVKYAPIIDGSFRFESLNEGNYLLKISCAGFLESIQQVSIKADQNLTITLEASVNQLKGVVVSTNRRVFSNKNGNTKINIENSVFAGSANVGDLLGKLPLIQVGSDGESINIIGKGQPLLYIGNRKITLEELNSLAVNDIKSIEIINNPSAKYESDGRAVILVTLKTGIEDGNKLDLTQTLFLRKYFTARTSANLIHRKNKIEWKTAVQYNQIRNWERNSYDFIIPFENISTGYDVTSVTTRPQAIINSGLFCKLNSEDYLSFSSTLRVQSERFPINTSSYLQQAGNTTGVITSNLNHGDRSFFTTNINYNRQIKTLSTQLFTGIQYSSSKRNLDSRIYNSYNSTPDVLDQSREQNNLIRSVNARTDITTTLTENWKLENGINISLPQSDAGIEVESFNPPGYERSDYTYQEKVFAAYTQTTGKIQNIEVSGGVRIEKAKVDGRYAGSGSPEIKKNYVQAFPKAEVNIPVDSSKTLTLGYAKTIARPDYASVSRLTQFINPYFEWSSNPNLQPVTTQEISVNLQQGDNSARLAYYVNNGAIYANFLYNPQQIRLTRQDINFRRESGFTLTVTCPFRRGIWSSNNTLTGGINRVNDPSANFRKASPYLYVYTNQQVRLPKSLFLSLTASGVTARSEGVFRRNGFAGVDTTVTKTFANGLNVSVNANNIFNSLRYDEDFTVNSIVSSGSFYTKSDFSVVVRYSFGKSAASKYQNRDVDDAINRIK